MQGVVFKPGRPVMGESIELAVLAPSELGGLVNTVKSLKSNPAFRIEIVGHVDEAECRGKVCRRLAQRRAVYVFRHLLATGVDPKQIISIRESGSALPISTDKSERWRNRRAELLLRDDLFDSPDL